MTLILNLPPEIEEQLTDEAIREGVEPAALAIRRLAEGISSKPPSSLPETELLLRINEGLPETFWSRYDELSRKRQSESLTEEEHQELIALSDQIEEKNADRLQWLILLAHQRQISIGTLTAELGISPGKHA